MRYRPVPNIDSAYGGSAEETFVGPANSESMALEFYEIFLVFAGIAAIGVGLLPRYTEQLPISNAMLYVAFGLVVFSGSLGFPIPDPLSHGRFIERLTELGVIIALMTAGLKLDRPLGLRRWESTWRLLGITMPLTVALVALIGWWAGFAVSTAILLGAVIAPTDPVLATEVQVEGPEGSSEDESRDDADGGKDETRFALTSEAGLNDGLAFPFTNLAVAVALVGVAPVNWLGEWLLVDVLFRLALGVVGGIGVGWVMANLIFITDIDPEAPLAKSLLGVEALGATLITYGVVEFLGGYGFIAVFVAATVIRSYERQHVYYEELHDLSEKFEQLLMAVIMVLFGGLIAGGLFTPLSWKLVGAAVVTVFVVRPLAGAAGLIGFERRWSERAAISFYGVRGIGTFYYLSFALNKAAFPAPDVVWALAGLVVLLSIVVHGVTSTPVVSELLGEESPAVETQTSS